MTTYFPIKWRRLKCAGWLADRGLAGFGLAKVHVFDGRLTVVWDFKLPYRLRWVFIQQGL